VHKHLTYSQIVWNKILVSRTILRDLFHSHYNKKDSSSPVEQFSRLFIASRKMLKGCFCGGGGTSWRSRPSKRTKIPPTQFSNKVCSKSSSPVLWDFSSGGCVRFLVFVLGILSRSSSWCQWWDFFYLFYKTSSFEYCD
jgi:hypothetical protein